MNNRIGQVTQKSEKQGRCTAIRALEYFDKFCLRFDCLGMLIPAAQNPWNIPGASCYGNISEE